MSSRFIAGTIVVIGVSMLAAFAVILGCILGTLAGAFIGWVLMLVGIAPWVYDGLAQLGLHVTNLWQLGAALGFVGGFFRASLDCKKEKD